MTQLPIAALSLSPALALADPPMVAQQAAAGQRAARHLQSRAAGLAGLSSRMQSGLWSGGGATAFVQAADEQAERLVLCAGLVSQLADAQATLAGQLGQARTDAVAAADRGRRLDAEAEAINQRSRAQQALLIHDPSSGEIADARALAVAAGLQRAALDLDDAEARARRAWQAAQASFDAAAYSTPAVRRQMLSAGWDPATSVSMTAATANYCGVMDELGLPAGGVLTGPDGRAYPLIVQTARGSDGKLLVTTLEQPAALLGWTQLAVRYGRTSFGPKASGLEKWAIALGATAGAEYPMESAFAPDLLGDLHLMTGGGAYVPAQPDTPGDIDTGAIGEPLRGKKLTDYWVAPDSGLVSGRRTSTPDAVGLLDAGLGGYLLTTRLDDARAADYRVVFEESSTGEVRARMQLFRVLTSSDQPPSTVADAGYVDKAGRLEGAPVTGEDPNRQASMRPAGN